MAYPIQELDLSTATDQDKAAAVQATLEQMIQEGASPEEAQQKVMEMMQAMSSMGTRSPQSTRTTMGGYASSGGGAGNDSTGMQSQKGMNRAFTNFTPMRLPPGGNSPGYQRYGG